jgi:hypothetical protein
VQAPPGFNYIATESGFVKGKEGSPYLGDWELADLSFINGSVMDTLSVRYNVYNNQMLYQENDKTYVMGAPDSIAQIKFADKTFVYREYSNKGVPDKSYFEVAQPGKVQLLVKYEIEVIPANYNVALMSGNKNDVLTIVQKLYLQKGSDIEPILKKDRVLELLADKKLEVATRMSKERLSFKKKKDMMALLEYYNQL